MESAQKLTASLLVARGNRWRHSRAAASAAAEVAATVGPEDRELLVATAWLHDVGYVHPQPSSGFHPIDGARLLLAAGWPHRLASLVAHHSEARFAASALGLEGYLSVFDREVGPLADALVYADATAGPDGRRLRLGERVEDIHRRHATEAPALREARLSREPHIELAAARVDVRARRLGLRHFEALPVSCPPADGDLVSGLLAEHPERDELDVRAALHAAMSRAGSAIAPVALHGRAARLLAATRHHRVADD